MPEAGTCDVVPGDWGIQAAATVAGVTFADTLRPVEYSSSPGKRNSRIKKYNFENPKY